MEKKILEATIKTAEDFFVQKHKKVREPIKRLKNILPTLDTEFDGLVSLTKSDIVCLGLTPTFAENEAKNLALAAEIKVMAAQLQAKINEFDNNIV